MSGRVVVTGAGGFVGRPAVAELARRGFEVHGVDVRPAPDLDVVAWHETDLLDADAVRALIDSVAPTHVLHLAWTTEHGQFWEDDANDEWVTATADFARTFAGGGGRRFVLAGTCTQYDWGDAALAPDGIAREASTPRVPENRYGRAKEAASRDLESIDGLSAATGLVFFPYGPFEKPERLIPSIARRLLAGEPAETTEGTQVRDFLHVDDTGRALAALADGDVAGSVNIGAGEGAAVVDVARAIARELGREDLLRVGAIPQRENEPARLVADVTRLRAEVGFAPTFSLETGLRDAVEWWRSADSS